MNSLTSAFNNLKVNAKIMLGFAVVLAIMVVVGVTAYRGITHVGDNFEGYAQRVGVVDAVSDIDREFLSYRRLVREASSEDDAEAAKKTHEAEEGVKKAIEHGVQEIHNPERHKK